MKGYFYCLGCGRAEQHAEGEAAGAACREGARTGFIGGTQLTFDGGTPIDTSFAYGDSEYYDISDDNTLHSIEVARHDAEMYALGHSIPLDFNHVVPRDVEDPDGYLNARYDKINEFLEQNYGASLDYGDDWENLAIDFHLPEDKMRDGRVPDTVEDLHMQIIERTKLIDLDNDLNGGMSAPNRNRGGFWGALATHIDS
ncbi:hypothetical protein ASF30_10240 [Leifsonia sp. Leaf264]|nr:hypothetical protein ASF30_10240 [Leifsonia sp. Leaf264]